MTDNEIIKALEICSGAVKDGSCRDCPRYHFKDNVFGCSVVLIKHSLSLINRQKADIESLKKQLNRLYGTSIPTLIPMSDQLRDELTAYVHRRIAEEL